MSKRKSKVKLPCDITGTPINVGDWLMFSDGPFHVCTMTYYGKDLESVGAWTAEDEEGNFCDNLKAGIIITCYKSGELHEHKDKVGIDGISSRKGA